MADEAAMISSRRMPRFIKDEAADSDSFGAHARIASAIALAIESDPTFKVIGLLGPWGSGKSTVAKLIELAISEQSSDQKTYFFSYDTWLHQSDPARRAFLESLIYFLIEKELTTIDVWKDRIDQLNRRIEDTETTSTPTLTFSGRIILVSLLFLPLGLQFLGYEWLDAASGTGWHERVLFIDPPILAKILFPIGLFLTILPLIIGFAIYFSWRPKRSIFSAAFWTTHRPPHEEDSIISIFANKEIQRNRSKITRSPDPTAIEFQSIFREIMRSVSSKRPKFVFVIDNLDRLPETDAISMWGTIRSFFLGASERVGKRPGDELPVIILPIDERAVRRMYAARRWISSTISRSCRSRSARCIRRKAR
jgi:energy-coupling factor transporter ATP-binding protein EcfA2